MKAHFLNQNKKNKWLILGHDVERPINVADTNNVLMISGKEGSLIDPGGLEIFPKVLSTLTSFLSISGLKNIILTSGDPQSVSSLALWRKVCPDSLKVWAPDLLAPLLSHLDSECDFCLIPDSGMNLILNTDSNISLIPSHYLYSPSAYTIFDSTVGALYSGSIGASDRAIYSADDFSTLNFDEHIKFIEPYHKRWFSSQEARNAWLSRVEPLDISVLVPQRGAILSGRQINQFFSWFKNLEIGDVHFFNVPDVKLKDRLPNRIARQETKSIFEEQRGSDKFRLVTRSDFDGIVCAAILEELELIDDILFAHPNDMQEGRITITNRDIITNLPYVFGCHLAFDHHSNGVDHKEDRFDNYINQPEALSTARVVLNYFSSTENRLRISDSMMTAVDKSDSAQYKVDEILKPEKWTLLNFIMDPRTGLNRFKGFRVPNYEMMMSLVDCCRDYSIEEILALPDIKERADFLVEQTDLFKDQLKRCAIVNGNLVVINLLEEKLLYAGNRFMVYALFPQCNISMTVGWGRDRQKIVFALGKSIINRSSKTNIGDLLLTFGGGGHQSAGTCQITPPLFDSVRRALVHRVNQDG